MPLDSQNTKNDVVWTATTTQSWTINYWTHWWVDCADFTNWWYIVTNTLNIPWQWTFLMWVNNINWYSWTWNKWAIWRIDNWNVWLSYNSSWYYAWEDNTYFNKSDKNKRFLLVYCNTSNTSYKKQYIFDWTNLSSISAINNSQWLNTALTMWFWNEKSGWQQRFLWYLSQAIFENKLRTEQEILNYIRKTKWKYGY